MSGLEKVPREFQLTHRVIISSPPFRGERPSSSSFSFPEFGGPFLSGTLDAERKPFVSLLPEILICFRRKCYDPTQPTDGGELILWNFCGIPCLQIKKFKIRAAR
ncbi:hypothetical protein OPV22_023353 [Ensete ventricosum]|uniref:UBC core domain-containing protein n=1 Tax=Ensete ventricosum TaxID=4639 RepID=A0AAV8PF52_ENSVE|nr:hypothetical protein OPV22_023353 [Ensete ventricosum]